MIIEQVIESGEDSKAIYAEVRRARKAVSGDMVCWLDPSYMGGCDED